MKKNLFLSVTSLAGISAAMLFSSCSPITPETRIQKNPSLYENLPESHKALARQGQIKEGMHQDAVFIAWGKPANVTRGHKKNKSFERWVYSSPQPVYHHGISPYLGYGWGRSRCGHRRGFGRSIYGVGINPSVTYVRRTRAWVNFNHSNKVESWEARR